VPPDPNGNLALGRAASATSQSAGFAASNVTDGNASSYWESANGAFPQSVTVDLGAARQVGRIVLKLPPSSAWGARTQTLSVLGSNDGSAFGQLVGSAGYRFDPASGNSVTIPVSANQRYLRVTVTANTGWPAGQVSEFEVYAATGTTPPTTTSTTTTTTPPTGNLARGKQASASSQSGGFGPSNTTDGDANSYWESVNGTFPQSVTVDLGSSLAVGRLVLKLPPSSAWATRTQTLSVEGSADGGTYRSLVGSAGYAFDPATGNSVTITFPATSAKFVRLAITGNTGWPAGQVSEFEVYAG
jgi:hypothetical protein